MSTGIREEVAYTKLQREEHLSKKFVWKRPLNHIVERQTDTWMCQDASTRWGAGGYCAALTYWWQITWSEFGEVVGNGIKDKSIHINVLELVAIVINYFAAAAAFEEQKTDWQPRDHCGGDNATLISWYAAFSNLNQERGD